MSQVNKRHSLANDGAYDASMITQQLSQLASEWKAARGHTASINKWVRLPAYQQIIEIGRSQKDEAVSFLLSELDRAPDHWFWALKEITGENPVSEESRGDVDAMAKSWIRWGKQSGYRW